MRLAGGIDDLNFVDKDFGLDEKGRIRLGETVSNGKGGRTISITDIGDMDTMSVVLGHEAYRDGVVGANNKQETRDAVLAHTKMAARMREEDSDFSGSFVGLDLAAYDRALSTGNMGIMDAYADALYDSSGDYWKLTKDEKGNWGWEPDGSLDFNFDLADKEIASAFLTVFGANPKNVNMKDNIGSIDFVNMTVEKRRQLGIALGITGPLETKYLSNLKGSPNNIALNKFMVNTENKLNESIFRNFAINTYMNNTLQLKANGVQYERGGGDIGSNGVVLGSSAYMDCTALISYLTQTKRTGTSIFGSHTAFKTTSVPMPGDVFVYLATDSNGKRNDHAVVWLGGDSIVDSVEGKGPRSTTLSRTEKYYTDHDFTYTRRSYGLKSYEVTRRW
jgi:hypothetical protein